jgi:hypothetical protein
MVKGNIKPMEDFSDKGPASGAPPPPYPDGQTLGAFPPYSYPPKPPTNYGSIAGILLIIVGIILIFTGASIFMLDMDLILEETSSSGSSSNIVGEVTDENGEPLEDVELRVQGTDEISITNAQGEYILENVKEGKQVITVTKENYTTIEHKKYITSFDLEGTSVGDIEIDFTMRPGNGTEVSGDYEDEAVSFIETFLQVCAVLMMIVAVIAFIGAVFAIKRTKYYFVVIACVLGIIFGLGLIFIGSILSIIALVLAYMGRSEFKKPQEPQAYTI